MDIRHELAQLRAVAREELRVDVRRRRHEVSRRLELPRIPLRRRRVGEVWGVSMVKNEEDVIRQVIEHLLEQGVDRLIVADNLSEDDTPVLLRHLAARDSRVLVAHDRLEAYHQDHKMTLLARAASRSGADWVVPFDADELWFAEAGSVAEHLRQLGSRPRLVATVRAAMHDTIPSADPDDAWDTSPLLVNATQSTLGKVAVRAHPTVRIGFGNHGAARVGEQADGLHIAHVVYRNAGQLARKVRSGSDAISLASSSSSVGSHWRDLAALSDAEVARLWREIQSGVPHPEIALNEGGPIVPCRPLEWATWDPDEVLGARTKEGEA